MHRQQLFDELHRAHADFIALFSNMNPKIFESALLPGKWTPGQQLLHIYKSVKPVRQGLLLPVFIPRLLFGPPGHEPMPYEIVVKTYQKKLAEGFKAPAPFVPEQVSASNGPRLCKRLQETVAGMCASANRLTDTQLDTICFPHPSLGRITIREMLQFTLYHVRHHHHQVETGAGK